MKNQPNNNSSIPFIIIGLVLLIALAGGWWLYKSSGSSSTRTNTNKTPARAQTTPVNAANVPPGAPSPHTLGSPTASVTIEEFADYQCPTCAVKYPLAKEIVAVYGNRIKFIFRNYPLSQIHPKAYDAAVAAEAAGLQGKFWDMQNQLFTNQQTWSTASDHRKIFQDYAQKIGLDIARFQNDMLGLAAKGRVDADLERARAMNISSTPTFLINGTPVGFEQMDIASMRQLIDAELQRTQSGSTQQAPPSAPPATQSTTSNSNATNTSNAPVKK